MAVGGAMLALLSARWLMLIAGSLLLSAAIWFGLHPIPAPSRGPGAANRRGGRWLEVMRATLAGNTALLRDRRIRRLLFANWMPVSIGAGTQALIVPYTAALGKPASAAGPLLAATSIGMVLGNGLVGRFCRPAMRERLVFPLALLLGVPLLAFALRPPLPAVFGLLLVFGAGFSYQLGIQQAFLDSVPPGLRGRAFGLNSTGVMGGQGVTQPLVGAVASLLGPASTIAAIGAAMIAVVLGLRRPLHPGWLAPEADTAAQAEDLAGDVTGHR
jgi:predicted MFS family arabinose efflux permease